MSKVNWQGVFPAVTTQFKPDQSLDLEATAKHIDELIRAGVHGLVMIGTVGENTSLVRGEKLDVLRTAVHTSAGRVPVISGVAEYTTMLAAEFAREAAQVGADGLMVLPAMVYKSDPRETVTHFRTVARASALPVMVYNNPVSYGVDITPEMFAELADEPTLAIIKESSENVRRVTDLYNLVGDRYVLFAGVDDLVFESLLLGVRGWVSGLVNAFPEESVEFWDLATSGKHKEALKIYRWYTPLLHLDTMPKLVQYIKLVAQEAGRGSEMVRAPRLPLAGAEREHILALTRKAIGTRPRLRQPA